jgi:hypothetical protein
MKVSMIRARKAIADAGWSDRVRLWLNMHDALEYYVHESLSPLEVIKVLQPAVVWTHPLIAHWPPMVADWHIWEAWGSPRDLKLEFGPSGEVTEVREVKPEKPAEPPPAAWITDSGGEDEAPVSLDLAVPVVVPPPAGAAPGSRLIIEMAALPDAEDFGRLLRLAEITPGSVPVLLVTPDGSVKVSDGCGLTEASAPEVALILRGARLRAEAPVGSAV